MEPHTPSTTPTVPVLPPDGALRRRLVAAAGSFGLAGTAANPPTEAAARSITASASTSTSTSTTVLYTFGDSILDCGRYNAEGVHPGQLLLRNDDQLFPAFTGQDLLSRGPARLVHCAVDGATVGSLQAQARRATADDAAVALLTVGGNDLLQGLAADTGPGLRRFTQTLGDFLQRLPVRRVLIGTVYDPTFGDDRLNFLGVAPTVARANLQRVNEVLAVMARRHGSLVDLHGHFLRGSPDWFVRTIEPSLIGASEVRRAFGIALGVVRP
ncbi:MAG: GDSL-like lipase/acylhydrolase [Rhodoferax sp.]|nr:GDSL-like lipase/acylhydrolase [Rhodoferax sp.]